MLTNDALIRKLTHHLLTRTLYSFFMVDLAELVNISKQAEKARIGLPPGHRDLDARVVFLIGTRAHFADQPVQFDEIINIGVPEIMKLGTPTDQQLGIMEGQFVLQITVPDVPNALTIMNDIHDKTQLMILIGRWSSSTLFSKFVVNHMILQVQARRLERANRIATDLGLPTAKRLQSLIRTAKLSRSVSTRVRKQGGIVRKIKPPRRLIKRAVFRGVLRVFIVVGLALDVIIVTQATAAGAQRGGLAGALGGFVGGVADALTLGLLEEESFQLGVEVETAAREFQKTEIATSGLIGFGGIG